MLQPLDRTVFGPFNTAYNTACSQFLSESPYHIINKGSFPSIFKKAWDSGVSTDNIVHGFRACGIIPFNPSAIPSDAYDPAVATEKPVPSTSSKPSATAVIPPTDGSGHEIPENAIRTIIPNADVGPVTTSPSEFVSPHATISTPVCSASLSVDSTPPNRIVSSSGDLTSPTRTADPSFDSTSSGRTGSSPVQPLAIPGIEMDENFELKLYCLILSDKIEIITADVEGIANFSANNESLETDKQSPVVSSTVWNTAVDSIFLPSTTPKENVQPKKSDKNYTSASYSR